MTTSSRPPFLPVAALASLVILTLIGAAASQGNAQPAAVACDSAPVEAESGVLQPAMQIYSDAGASEGRYVATPCGASTGAVTVTVSAPCSGVYRILARVSAEDYVTDSFFVAIDSGSEAQWGFTTATRNAWFWEPVSHWNGTTTVVQEYQLAAGSHRIRLRMREAGARVDVVQLVVASTGPTPTPTPLPTTGHIAGRVTDASTGIGIAGVTIQLVGTARTALQTLTDGQGYFTLYNVPAGPRQIIGTIPGYAPLTLPITVGDSATVNLNFPLSHQLTTGSMRFVLTWGANPRDLDGHLWLPDGHDVYYGDKGSLTAYPWAALDWDARYGNGPETTTIAQRLAGSYTYAVHRFAGTGSIATSGASVRVYDSSGLTLTLNAPEGSGDLWCLLRFNGATGTPSVINRYVSSSSDCINAPDGPADSGFRPNPDGFGFANTTRGASQTTLPPRASWENTFDNLGGLNSVWSELVLRTVYPYVDGSGGFCHGMASVSTLYYLHQLDIDVNQWQWGAHTLHDINSIVNTFREHGVDVFQGAQLSTAQVQSYLQQMEGPPTVASALDRLRSAIQQGQPAVLSFVPRIEGSLADYRQRAKNAHSVVAFRYTEVAGGDVLLDVYNVNGPAIAGFDDGISQVHLTPAADSFWYQLCDTCTYYSSGGGWTLLVTPSTVLTDPNNRRLASLDEGLQFVSDHADLTVVNGSGLTVGQAGALLVHTIPQATILSLLGSDNAQPLYIVPPGQAYTATVTGNASGAYQYLSTGPSGGLQLDADGTSPGERDEVAVSATYQNYTVTRRSAGPGVASAAPKPFSVALVRLLGSQAREFGVNNLAIGVGEAVNVSTVQNDGELRITNRGAATSYTLHLARSSGGSAQQFWSSSISLGRNDTHRLHPSSWSNLSLPVVQDIDRNSDGSIDQTISLPNRARFTFLPLIMH